MKDSGLTRQKKSVRILVVDDHPLVRESLKRIIQQQSDLSVCGETALSLLVGDWLLARHQQQPVPVNYLAIRTDGTPNTPWPDMTEPTALLVMGDGSARRSVKGPGYLDERAQPFDDGVVDALAKAAPKQLAALDLALAAELLVAGAPAWVAVATLVGGDWHGEVLYADAPYGVMYAVATWLPA